MVLHDNPVLFCAWQEKQKFPPNTKVRYWHEGDGYSSF